VIVAVACSVCLTEPQRLPSGGEDAMQLGMVGLGRMGANLVRRLLRGGHQCVVFDVNPASVHRLRAEGAVGAASLGDLAAKLSPPRAAWVMVPAGVAGRTVAELAERLEPDDVLIDGGNSYYRDDVRRAQTLAARGIHYLDIGTSGGIYGLDRGFCLMIGGQAEVVHRLDPIFRTLAPGVAAAARTPVGRASRRPLSRDICTVARSAPATSSNTDHQHPPHNQRVHERGATPKIKPQAKGKLSGGSSAAR
jgi:3-hydroxyisobutyrate dehydrogenase-like beta-hydroxyacid dehydrogenase